MKLFGVSPVAMPLSPACLVILGQVALVQLNFTLNASEVSSLQSNEFSIPVLQTKPILSPHNSYPSNDCLRPAVLVNENMCAFTKDSKNIYTQAFWILYVVHLYFTCLLKAMDDICN
jgi:hypothetical protein